MQRPPQSVESSKTAPCDVSEDCVLDSRPNRHPKVGGYVWKVKERGEHIESRSIA